MTTVHSPSASQKLKLLDRVRAAIHSRHYSRNTEDAYVAWIKRYIPLHRKRRRHHLHESVVQRTVKEFVRRQPAGRSSLHAPAAYPGQAQGLSHEAEPFAGKGIPSAPMAGRTEIGCSTLQP